MPVCLPCLFFYLLFVQRMIKHLGRLCCTYCSLRRVWEVGVEVDRGKLEDQQNETLHAMMTYPLFIMARWT